MKKNQEIYINLDDSGKLSKKEVISVYGGIVFFSKPEKDKFITQYRTIINDIKCNYCNQEKGQCNKDCPEIKNINIKPSDKRRIMNYIKKYFIVSSIINNNQVFNYIMENKASKGRYIDYTIRRLIKEIIKKTIELNIIKPNEPICLIINIDQQTTKNNGYYNLENGLIEELIHGIHNFDYNKTFEPILFSDFELKLSYQNSSKSYVVQASDLIAGTIRKICIKSKDIDADLSKFVDLKIIFP